jgi:hypothetical protein
MSPDLQPEGVRAICSMCSKYYVIIVFQNQAGDSCVNLDRFRLASAKDLRHEALPVCTYLSRSVKCTEQDFRSGQRLVLAAYHSEQKIITMSYLC